MNWCVVWEPRSLRCESLRSRGGTVEAQLTTKRKRRMGLRGSQTPFYREPTPAIMTLSIREDSKPKNQALEPTSRHWRHEDKGSNT